MNKKVKNIVEFTLFMTSMCFVSALEVYPIKKSWLYLSSVDTLTISFGVLL